MKNGIKKEKNPYKKVCTGHLSVSTLARSVSTMPIMNNEEVEHIRLCPSKESLHLRQARELACDNVRFHYARI